MMIIHGNAGRLSLLGPPTRCQKCRKSNFDKIDWPNKDGTVDSVFSCSGCGRVYELQPIDVMANLLKAFEYAGFAASFAASAFGTAWCPFVQRLADEEEFAERARAVMKAASTPMPSLQEAAQAAQAFTEEAAPMEIPIVRRDPHRLANWKATQARHAQRYRGKKR
jgi:hypothetical protein